MSTSYTNSEAVTFTLVHAKHLASKIATDLKRMQRLYPGCMSDAAVAAYEEEATEMLKAGCLEKVGYGYQRAGNWVEPSLHYKARDLQGSASLDDDPGKITANVDVTGASFGSYMIYSSAWSSMSASEKEALRARLPFQRGDAPMPGVTGYLVEDKTYSAGGRALSRSSVRSS